MRRKNSASVDGGPTGGSSVHRPVSEDPISANGILCLFFNVHTLDKNGITITLYITHIKFGRHWRANITYILDKPIINGFCLNIECREWVDLLEFEPKCRPSHNIEYQNWNYVYRYSFGPFFQHSVPEIHWNLGLNLGYVVQETKDDISLEQNYPFIGVWA